MANPTLLNVLPLEQRQESKETLANKKSKEEILLNQIIQGMKI